MTFVCLWIPHWPTGEAATSSADEGAGDDGTGDDDAGVDVGDAAASSSGLSASERCASERCAAGWWATDDPVALVAALVGVAPRVVVEQGRGIVWADAHGLAPRRLARALLRLLERHGSVDARAGIARTAIVAEIAAVHAPVGVAVARDASERTDERASERASKSACEARDRRGSLVRVPAGAERRFLAPYALEVLAPTPRLLAMLADVGIGTCGELAALEREAVEVRFGSEGLALWRLARADDPRRIFGRAPRALPTASAAWTDYTLRRAEPLLFVINRLAATVCAELRAWGEGAGAMTLDFSLADRTHVRHTVRTARATASRTTWMRRMRTVLDHVRLPDAVTGIALTVDVVAGAVAAQGDLFDRGFATASAVDESLAQLVDEGRSAVIEVVRSAHPLPERRVEWRARAPVVGNVVRPGAAAPAAVMSAASAASAARAVASVGAGAPTAPLATAPLATASLAAGARLELHLRDAPERIDVDVEPRRGCRVPVRYRTAARTAARTVELATVAGPDRLSNSGAHQAAYEREYFHAATEDGSLVLLYRDARADAWYLHGWWD